MWKDPEEVENICTKRKDTTAPARSAIRRQRTVRHSGRAQSSVFRFFHDGHASSGGRVYLPTEMQSQVMTEPMPNEIANPAYARQGNGYLQVAENRHTEATQRVRVENGRVLLRDALSYERPDGEIRAARDMNATTAPESQADHAVEERQPAGPGITSHGSEQPADDSFSQDIATSLGMARFTPGFAPAHRLPNNIDYHRMTENQGLSMRSESLIFLSHRLPTLRAALRDDGDCRFVDSLMTEIEQMRLRNPTRLTPDYLTEEASYLRHIGTRLNLLADHSMGNLQLPDINALPQLHRTTGTTNLEESHSLLTSRRREQASLDGLGDRQRSFSPDDDGWDTMLMTIPLDERVPSAHSSFSSTAASNASLAAMSTDPSSVTATNAPSISTHIEICPAPENESDNENVDIIEVEPLRTENPSDRSHSRLSEYELFRMDSSSHRLDRRRADEDHHTQYRHLLEREQDLQRLESSLRRLERQVTEDAAISTPSARQRPEERL